MAMVTTSWCTPANAYSFLGAVSGTVIAWSNPTNALTADSAFASAVTTGTQNTQELVLSGFNLASVLPSTVATYGVEVEVTGSMLSGSANFGVALIYDKGTPPNSTAGYSGDGSTSQKIGAFTSTNTAVTVGGQYSIFNPNTSSYDPSWGGSGGEWTVASRFRNTNFAVGIQRVSGSGTYQIDAVRVRVWYDDGAPVGAKTFGAVITEATTHAVALSKFRDGILGHMSVSESTTYAVALSTSSPAANSATGVDFPTVATVFRGGTSGPDSTWTNPTNVLATDGVFCTGTFGSTDASQALLISNFGFSLPTTGTIRGYEVIIRAKVASGTGTLKAGLFKTSSTITWSTQSLTFVGFDSSLKAASVGTTLSDITLGSASDVWGAYITASGVNSSNFGVIIQHVGGDAGGTFSIDSVTINVHYTAQPTTKTLSFTLTESRTSSSSIVRARKIAAQSNEFLNYAAGVSKSSSGPTSTSPTNPTTSSGTGWTGTANIYAQDGSNATITPVTTGSAPLKAQGFGFTIPVGATINGISFDAYAYQAGGTSGTIDVEVRALKADGSASSSSASTTSINTTASYKTYGSSSSLWGETWTYADINDADFGVQIIPTAVSGGGGGSTTSGYAVAGTASSTTETSGTWGPNTSSLVNDVANADSAFVYYQMGSLAATDTRNPFLTLTNFGFSIPTGATISAVEVSVNRRFNDSGGGVSCKFDTVKLVVGGTAVGTNKATTTTWPSTYSYDTFGDTTSDLWGNTLSPADVNASDFGVTMRAIAINSNTDGTARIDHVRVRVTYTSPSSPDRVFTVDHVRATVNYTPVDQTAKLVTFSLAETGGTSFGSFTRGRNVPFTSSESTALTAAVKRNRTVSTTVTQLYDIVLDIIRARNVPVSITIAEVEQILSNLQVTRAPVTATQSPTAVSEGTGTYGWTNTSNVFVQDGAVAYIDPHTSANKPLRITNFGYSLVPGVTVLGVKFEAYAYQSGGTVGTVDVQAKLIKADGTTTTASETITAINTVPSYKTYGSSSSLWGTTLTGADINDVDFGIEITPIGVAGGGPTSTGLVNPGSVSQVTGNLSRSWTNITNVLAADGSYTSLQTDISPGDSTFIVPSNFGLSIPAGSTIDGIEVAVTAYGTTTGSGNVLFDTVQLTSAGSPIGTGQSSNEIVHASTATSTTFGGATNNWGAALTDTLVNASTFGVRVRFKDDGQFSTENVFVDSIQLKVYYTQTAIPPDRRLNVDHVRAIVTYTPIDLKSLGAIVVSYLEAMSAASNRSRRVVPTITEVETATAAVKRARLASFAVPETMTLTTALSRLKQVAVTLAESVGHTFTASRLRQLQQQSIAELETFSFGSLRRIRNVITSLQETTTTVANVIRARALPLTVAEQEAITEAIGLARKLAVTLNEQLVVTPQLSRKKQIAAAIAEVETLSATYIKVKFMVAAINYVESVATTNIIRTRALAPLIAEVEADAVALGRSRKISTVIPQTETVQSTLARFRKALVSVLEQESIAPITAARLRGVIAQLHEQEQFDVALSIILASASPEVIGVTMTWYEQEVKIDGTVNYKLMSETWNVKRSADIVTVDIAVPATQIINI